MENVYITSDTHFGHDREFLWGPRGFSGVLEHDKKIIENWNAVVKPEDTVYHLGDVMLGDNEYGMSCLRQLNGNIVIIPGNHDTKTRLALYETLPNVRVLKSNVPDLVPAGVYFKYKKYMFYFSHHPTMTSNLEKDPYLRAHLINIFGHTHQKKRFYNDIPFMFHAGLDSNNCAPVLLDDAIVAMREEMKKCVDMLDIDETLANVAEEVREGGETCPTQLDIWTTIAQQVKKLFSKK